MRIGLDLDDVLADSLPRFVEAFRESFGRAVAPEGFRWEPFRDFPDIDPAAQQAFLARLDSAEFFGTVPPMPGAPEAVRALRQAGHALVIVTGRPVVYGKTTREWLERHGIAPYIDGVVHRDGMRSAAHKVAAVRRYRLDGLVEDEYAIAWYAVEQDVPVLLFDRPWNRKSLRPGLVRVHSWPEVLSWIQDGFPRWVPGST
ncbi:MAG: HAD family hydrolase [Candidatus Methylomirabilales bacterium]